MCYNFTMDWQIYTLATSCSDELIHYPCNDYQYNSMLPMQQELFILKKSVSKLNSVVYHNLSAFLDKTTGQNHTKFLVH